MKKLITLFIIYSSSFIITKAQSTDETAIKKIIEKETETWFAGDIKAHADCWVLRPYSRILVSQEDGTVFSPDVQNMINPPAEIVGGGGSSKNTNYKIGISGNMAWACYDQERTDKESKKEYSYQTRVLEKINGKWKITAETVHHYKLK